MFSNENTQKNNIGKFALKSGSEYLCIKDYYPRADFVEFEEGKIYKCEKDGVMGIWLIRNPEEYFVEL